MDIKIGDLVLIEEGIYKGEKAIVERVLDNSVKLYVYGYGDRYVLKPEYVTKVESKQCGAEEDICKDEKFVVKNTLDDLIRPYVCNNAYSDAFSKPECENKQYSVQEIFDLAQEGDIFLDENGFNKFIYKNGSIYDYVDDDDITEYYYLGAIMKMKFFKIVECSKVKINKRDLNDIVKLLRDNGYDYEIEEV